MDKTAIIGFLAAAFMIAGPAACLTVNTPLQAVDPTEDIGQMISAELTRVAPSTSNDATPSNAPPSNPTDTPLPQTPPPPQPTAALESTVAPEPLHGGPSIAELVARLRPSLAYINTPSASGSGFVYDRSGLIATNAHVVDCCRDVTITVDNRHYQGEVLGRDDRADLAVVRINSGDRFMQARLGSSRQVAVGDEVVALGFPLNLGYDLTATKGIISSRRTVGGYEHFQHDAPINPGNSGGPLINLDGAVIGMNTSKRFDAEGVGFALSVDEIEGRLATLAGSASAATPQPRPTSTPRPMPTYQPAPTNVPPVGDYQQVSAGLAHTCGVKTDGSIRCWGWNKYGQATPPEGHFQQVSAGHRHTCGLKTDGSAVCWGSNHAASGDYRGQTITGEYVGQSTPPADTFLYIDVDAYVSCGVKIDGNLLCWGAAEIATSLDTGISRPSDVQPQTPSGAFRKVSAGPDSYLCGIQTDDRLHCWSYYVPDPPPSGKFQDVDVGPWHVCGSQTDGRVVCWPTSFGNNKVPNSYSTPPTGTFLQISVGRGYTCGVKTDHHVVCWGNQGELSYGDKDFAPDYGQATPPADTFRQVDAGSMHTCGVKTDGAVVCWGRNSQGQSTPP